MPITSTAYLLFLPTIFILYWTAHKSVKTQNLLLLSASYLFYGWWDTRLLIIIMLMTIATYATALAIEHSQNRQHRKIIFISGITLCAATLGLFKYFNFFAQSLSELAALLHVDATFVTLNIILPAGISFYTFQSISYLIDIYRNDIPATRDFLAYATFIAFFPQLVAGPIERAGRMIPIFQSQHKFSYSQSVEGLQRLIVGLFKKMVIADNCAETVAGTFTGWNSQGSLVLAYGALLFTIEIYCDFSGYSDIAIGSAKLLGIELSENFRSPYLSKSISEFWRRWHVTLMNWFRDYIYIPLGGGRRHKIRNTFLVFLLSGLWHGANWTFVMWGIYNALLFAPFRKLEKRNIPACLMGLLTFSCVVFGFMIFRSADISSAAGYAMRMFSFVNLTAIPPSATHSLIALVAAAILFAVEYKTGEKKPITSVFQSMPCLARRITYIAIVAATIVFGAEPAAFIYFQF